MAKRRTKKQKIKAKHIFTNPVQNSVITSNTDKAGQAVKGQFNFQTRSASGTGGTIKYAVIQEKDRSLATIKKDLLRSLAIASFILALEMVLYLLGRFSLI